MKFPVILALSVTLVGSPLAAASTAMSAIDDRAPVLAAIEAWFGALRAKNREGFEALMLPDATFITLRRTADGWTRVRRDRAGLVDRLLNDNAVIVERFTGVPTVLVHGPTATVWGRYDFSIAGKRLHCGIDIFDLVRDGDAWKIANARWTVEPEGCAP